MLEWQEYVSQLLSTKSSFDGITLSFGNNGDTVGVPPIIKSSILMLDCMQKHQGKFNIMVFPERIQSIFIFTLVKLLHNISEGKIDSNYDPDAFAPGEKLRFKGAVAEYLGTEERDGKKCMVLRFSNMKTSAPMEYFPMFQKTNAQRLSKYEAFAAAKKQANAQIALRKPEEQYLQLLADHKTHMDSSIVNMTSIINTKELIADCKLCGQNIKEAILVGQADYEGNVRNIGAGQLGGTPAIVLAADLYAISAMAERGHPIQSIIIDGSNANALLSQMDALDSLMRLGVPITCVTDVVNSFDLQIFQDRGFNLWRWDETSLTEKLYDAVPLSSDRKTKNCAKRKVNYLSADGNEISTAIKLLYMHRKESQTSSAQMMKLFDKLFSLAFASLWETVPIGTVQLAQVRTALVECSVVLEKEKIFLSEKAIEDYTVIIECLKKVHTTGYVFQKHEMLTDILRTNHPRTVALVVPERCDKTRVQTYWQHWCVENRLLTDIQIYYPAEYYLLPCDQFTTTIVVGWLKRAIMRKILFSFNTQSYSVLLYDYEKRWRNYTTSKWNAALDSSHNRKTIEKSFTTDLLQVSTGRFVQQASAPNEALQEDEFAEIELVLRENKYRQYIASGGQKAENETTEAIPVNFVGGYLSFYRTGHKVISASNIIEHDADKIETRLPNELKMGDFVVVRESDHDLVREMADVMLAHSGKANLRELSAKWKEALEIETLFYSTDEIYEHLQKVGCTRGYQAVRSWITDEGMIAPQSKQDLEHIAVATGSGVLKEMLDEVYEAAQTVKTAHTQAGRILSQKLRERVVAALKDYRDIDPFNIWDPIEMQIEDVGLVRILKIIDIGSPVIVDITDTNRLIDE
ncbi:MAG: DrmE family protein [Candidatus Heteroscillospira sp.]|jgi:hypothetical protein